MNDMNIIEKTWIGWKVEKELGRGSYGTVYKCSKEINGIKEYSAVKVIAVPQSEHEMTELISEKMTNEQSKKYYKDIADDLVKEIEILKTLKGTKNIVEIYDAEVVEKDDGIGWYILIRMELLTDFNTYSIDKKFSEAEVIKLGLDISSALSVCHKAKIIHRDIKPENIFVDAEGNFKLGDFGVAKQMEKTQGSMSVKGTYNYMSPEVFSGKKIDGRADMYSLALVMYKLLNNDRLPFLDSDKQLIRYNERQVAFEKRIKGEQIPDIKGVNKNLNNIILMACSYRNNNRQKNIDEFKTQLEKIFKGQKISKRFKKSTFKKVSITIGVLITLAISGMLWCSLEKNKSTELYSPNIISIGTYENGMTSQCIDNKYLYKDENGIFIFDKKTDEMILVTDKSEISAAFDGERVIYAIFIKKYQEFYESIECSWNFFDVNDRQSTSIEELYEYYDGAHNDVVYFDDNCVLYKSSYYGEKQSLEMFNFKTQINATIGYSIEDVFVYDDDLIYTTDKTDSFDAATVWLYNAEKQSGVPISSKGILNDKSVFYKEGYLYFLEYDKDDINTLNLCKYSLHSESEGEKEILTSLTGIEVGSIAALNDKYICFENDGEYYLWSNKENILKKINIGNDYGNFIECFTNQMITDKIILLFEVNSKYQYYKVLNNGDIKLFGKVEADEDFIQIDKETIYSVSGIEDKKIKVYDIKYI